MADRAAETINSVTIHSPGEMEARSPKICLQYVQVFLVVNAELNPQHNNSQRYFGLNHGFSQQIFCEMPFYHMELLSIVP